MIVWNILIILRSEFQQKDQMSGLMVQGSRGRGDFYTTSPRDIIRGGVPHGAIRLSYNASHGWHTVLS